MLRSLSLRIARPVLMNGLPPPSDPGDATAPAEPGMKPPECITASHPSLPHHPDKCPTNDPPMTNDQGIPKTKSRMTKQHRVSFLRHLKFVIRHSLGIRLGGHSQVTPC